MQYNKTIKLTQKKQALCGLQRFFRLFNCQTPDYQLARLLASEVVTEEPFREISDESYEKALALLKKCKYVIDAGVPVGACNRRMEVLIKEAEKSGKLEKSQQSQQKSSFPLTFSGELFYNPVFNS